MRNLDPPDVIEIQATARERCRRSLKGIGLKPACASGPCVDCAAVRDATASLIQATQPEPVRVYKSYQQRSRKPDAEPECDAALNAIDRMTRTGRGPAPRGGVSLGAGAIWHHSRRVPY